MKRVLCLYRVSTKKQLDPNYTDISNADIPLQEIACRTYIANRPEWTLYDEKYERGVSGFKVSAAQRDVILDIQAEAVKKAFDVLLVYLSDRIGRKENETPFLVEWFVQNGIEVWTVQEGQLRVETHVDKLVNYIRFWEANGESLKTSIRVSDRQKQLVEDGIWRGGACPYGYNLVFNGRIGKKNRQLLDLVIEPAEAAIVREIFSLLCYEGWGSYRIANHLNSKYPNPDKVWTPRTVISLIRNPIYIGRMRFNDTITIKPIEHLRIIDDSLFEFAERALKEHIPKKYALSKSKSNGFVDVSRLSSQDSQEVLETLDLGVTKARVYGASLLSGILYCAHCDHKLVGTYHSKFNSRGERVYRPVYRCYNGAVKAKNCDGQRTYSAAKVEGAVLTTVRQYFSTFSRAIDELWRTQTTAELQRKSGFVLHNAQTELNKIMQRQMKLKEEAIKALTGESVYEPEMVQELLITNAAALKRAEKAVEELQNEQNKLDVRLKEMASQYENIRDWAEIFDSADVDEKKMILARIIKKITVNRNYEITIHFFLALDDFKKAFKEEGEMNVKIREVESPEKVLA